MLVSSAVKTVLYKRLQFHLQFGNLVNGTKMKVMEKERKPGQQGRREWSRERHKQHLMVLWSLKLLWVLIFDPSSPILPLQQMPLFIHDKLVASTFMSTFV
ncbi:hypothetical protein CFOL_v3_26331 [Cephalotus follicularis]|uniref:Uncharacterized protein n=1 Tax=Cephalotus follicularis TaxID=3775 RepID=A0A1Q3CRM3_CEPFO|nr:hypothetical protein CFOL_v3_26331 [Cephalotus follicularis]